MTVLHTVIRLLSEILSEDLRGAGPGFTLDEVSGVSPMDIARLAIACEAEFGFPLYDEKIAEWKTIGDACRHIEQLLEEGQGESPEHTEEERTGWFYE